MPKVPGTYDAVMPKKRLEPEDKSYQAEADLVKAKIALREALYLATNYALLRTQKEQLEESLYNLNVSIAAFEQLLDDSAGAKAKGWGTHGANDNAIRLESGETIRVEDQPVGRVIDKEAFRQWCIKNGYETQLQLWPSRMESIVKERLLAGEAGPDGTEDSHTHEGRVHKGKGMKDDTPAFPRPHSDCPGDQHCIDSQQGMTLRDYFAAQAPAGGMSQFYQAGDTWSNYGDFARTCYNIADAMIEAATNNLLGSAFRGD